MKQIPPHDFAAVSDHLERLLALAAEGHGHAARVAYLADLSRARPDLVHHLERLLAAREDHGFMDFLAIPPAQLGDVAESRLIGRSVGAYVIDAEIGRGGMGTVWRAHRSDGRFEGCVALKFVHPAWLGRGGEQRFLREGQFLARLDHSAIARLIDAGLLDDTHPFLVLEYVEGEPIDRYCERHLLSCKARLGLFLRVLEGVSHAHERLIVHRDLKPSNILVTAGGEVKLLDFGIAKLLQSEAPDQTRSTAHVLTPLYAAPEQLRGEDVTTATDVYALGLILAVMLTGKHPLAASGGAGDAAVSRSRAALSDGTLADEPRKLSTMCSTAEVRRYVQGDLENIVGKALKSHPQERYAGVAAFSGDLHRFLNDEPVHARPDTLSYRTAKFVRRHRGSVLSAALTALALVLTAGFALLQMLGAQQERDVARQ